MPLHRSPIRIDSGPYLPVDHALVLTVLQFREILVIIVLTLAFLYFLWRILTKRASEIVGTEKNTARERRTNVNQTHQTNARIFALLFHVFLIISIAILAVCQDLWATSFILVAFIYLLNVKLKLNYFKADHVNEEADTLGTQTARQRIEHRFFRLLHKCHRFLAYTLQKSYLRARIGLDDYTTYLPNTMTELSPESLSAQLPGVTNWFSRMDQGRSTMIKNALKVNFNRFNNRLDSNEMTGREAPYHRLVETGTLAFLVIRLLVSVSRLLVVPTGVQKEGSTVLAIAEAINYVLLVSIYRVCWDTYGNAMMDFSTAASMFHNIQQNCKTGLEQLGMAFNQHDQSNENHPFNQAPQQRSSFRYLPLSEQVVIWRIYLTGYSKHLQTMLPYVETRLVSHRKLMSSMSHILLINLILIFHILIEHDGATQLDHEDMILPLTISGLTTLLLKNLMMKRIELQSTVEKSVEFTREIANLCENYRHDKQSILPLVQSCALEYETVIGVMKGCHRGLLVHHVRSLKGILLFHGIAIAMMAGLYIHQVV